MFQRQCANGEGIPDIPVTVFSAGTNNVFGALKRPEAQCVVIVSFALG